MIILDSCIWISFFDEGDSQTKLADEVFLSITDWNQVFMPELVYFEILTVFRMKKKYLTGIKLLQSFMAEQRIMVKSLAEDTKLVALEKILASEPHSLSLTDCVLWAYAQEGHEIKTFDRALETTLKN